jgi:predicted lipid-binding transport protein (Tim44 family)
MNPTLVQILVLAAIAIFLIVRLRNVLGTRDGFEPPKLPETANRPAPRRNFDVIEGGIDTDIADHTEDGSEAADALRQMKAVEPGFSVTEFLHGARGAYEMILMAFESGELDDIRSFLSPEVYDGFSSAVEERKRQGLRVETEFLGLREVTLAAARFDAARAEAEIDVRFVAELTTVVRNDIGAVVEGDPQTARRQRDVWTFARQMGRDDPNWILVATGD